MKRFQQFPNESARIGQILFWLFPYEQSTFSRRGTGTQRATRGAAYIRGNRSIRQFNRAGVR
jgi:hypothetical protein